MTAPSPDDSARAAVLQIPSLTDPGNKRRIPCTFNGTQGRRLIVAAAEPLPVSTAVSVEYDDRLFLGEVLNCAGADQTAEKQTWSMEIKIEQILSGLQSLLALRAHLLSESVPHSLSLLPVGARN